MKHQICGIVTEPSHLQYLSGCDLVEIRADFLPRHIVPSLISQATLPVILTLRSKEHGGNFEGTTIEQQALLEQWAESAPAYIDVESQIDPAWMEALKKRHPHIQLLRSHHQLSHTPESLEEVYKRIYSPFASHTKIATRGNSSIDGLRMLQFVEKMQGAVTGFCLGQRGRFTRILAPGKGSRITFVPIGEKTDPGQLSLEEALYKYRLKSRTLDTALFGVIGQPICYSPSIKTHQEAFNRQHIDALYMQIEVAQEEWSDFFELARRIPFKGLSVTMPLKQMITPPINTLKFVDGTFEARNTDGIGAMKALGTPKGKKIAILGAGGAAQGIAREAEKMNNTVTLLNRHTVSNLPSIEYDILINTIPPPACPIEYIHRGTLCMEISVREGETPFSQLAKEYACTCVNGYAMFIHQANEQFKWWFETTDDFLHCPPESH